MNRSLWRWARLGGGALVIAVLVLRLGTGPFVDGVRRVDASSLIAAVGVTATTTVISAWRWRLIASGLGVRIPLGSAVSSYYRSQFLNSTLPGGIVGDVHRGVRLGTGANNLSRSLRSVAWDRAAGQAVQVVLAAVTLLALASPVRPAMTVVASVSIIVVFVITVAVLAIPHHGRSLSARFARTTRDDVRDGLLAARAAPAIVVASVAVVAGHLGVFLIAARAGGTLVAIPTLLPLSMLVLLSMSVPTSIGGWGPREGVAAWAFAAAGLTADRGVEIATTYGVLSLVAVLPGALVLIAARKPRRPVRAEAARHDMPVGELVGSAATRGAHG